MNSLLTIAVLFQLGLSGDIKFEAETLELGPGVLRTKGPFSLSNGRTRISGEALRLVDDPGCASKALHMGDAKVKWGAETELQARSAKLCLGSGSMTLSDVQLTAPNLRIRGAEVTTSLDERRLKVTRGSFTRCDCDEPSWMVDFKSAEIDAEGAWVDWPVLSLSTTPVLTVPKWYAPFGSRRSGLLAPTIGWRGDTGLSLEQPLYWAINDESDLTVSGGSYGLEEAIAGLEGRWLGRKSTLNHLNIDLVGQKLRGHGSIIHAPGPLLLNMGGEVITHPNHRNDFIDIWSERAFRDSFLFGRLDLRDKTYGVGTTVYLSQTSRRESLNAPERWIESRWIWSPDISAVEPNLAGRLLYGRGSDGALYRFAQMSAQLKAPVWLGPVFITPYVGGGFSAHNQSPSELRTDRYGSAGGELSLTWRRAWSALIHELSILVDAHWTQAYQPADRVDSWVRRRELNIHGVSLRSVLHRPGLLSDIRFRQGGRSTDGELHIASLGSSGLIRAHGLGVRWLTQDVDFIWSSLHLGQMGSLGMGASYIKMGTKGELPIWSELPDAPLRGVVGPVGESTHSVSPQVSFTVGSLHLEYAGAVDLREPTFAGQSGVIGWTSGCQCWSVKLSAQWYGSRRTPDFFMRFDLTPP